MNDTYALETKGCTHRFSNETIVLNNIGLQVFAHIVFPRPKSYPFFKTLWQTLFTRLKLAQALAPR